MENKENISKKISWDEERNFRFKNFFEEIKITQESFSEKTGMPQSNLSATLNNKRALGDKIIEKHIKPFFPELNIAWLLTGEGEMLKMDTDVEKEEEKGEITGYYYPNVDAAAGLDRAMFNEEIERVPVYLPNFGKGIDFINVYGDSMYPRYNAGEIIGIKHTEFQYLNYGYPYVVVFKNGDVFIKYVRKGKDDEHILLASENPIYEPREFHLELIKDFYSIRGVVKKEMM